MTRITFDWLIFFVGGGLLLLASGESTVSAIAENTTSITKEHTLLSVNVTNSPSVDNGSTSEHLQNNSDYIPPENNELKPNRSLDEDESSNHSSTHVSKVDVASATSTSMSNESITEDNIDKAELHKSESRTDLKIAEESSSSGEVLDIIQNENTTSHSDANLSTSEANTYITGVDQSSKNFEMFTDQSTDDPNSKKQSTEKSNSEPKDSEVDSKYGLSSASTKEYSESETNSALSSEETDPTRTGSSEDNTTEDTNSVETSGNPVTMETKSSLSSKSATRKRSINSTFTTTLSDESLPASILYSSPSPHKAIEGTIPNDLSTLLNAEIVTDNDFISTRESISSGVSEAMDGTSTLSLPLVYPHTTEMVVEDSQETKIKKENSVEMVHEIYPQESGSENINNTIVHNTFENGGFTTAIEFNGNNSESDATVFDGNLKPAKVVNHMEKEDIEYGVTFDPDGMKHDGPQDPDSVVFTVLPEVSTTAGTITIDSSTDSIIISGGLSHLGASGPEVERESNPDDVVVNRPQEFVELNKPDKERVEPLSIHVPFDGQNVESSPVSSTLNPISYMSTINPSGNLESQQTGASSSTNKHAEMSYSDFEMLQDAPNVLSSDYNQSKSDDIKVTEIETKPVKISVTGTSSSPVVSEVPLATESATVETSSSFIVRQTEPLIIRPFKMKFSSQSNSTSNHPAWEDLFGSSESTIGSALTTTRIGTNQADISSPVILPNPAPITTEKGNPTLELSTMLPELFSSPSDKAGDGIATETTNSTIAGVAVKTSVSVSLPLSNTRNDTSTLPSALEDLLKNSSIVIMPGNPPIIHVRPNNESSSPTESSSPAQFDSNTLSTTTPKTTTSAGIKILKPKIKVPGGSNTGTRRPYLPPSLKRPSTTEGPPVSIFKQARTRVASITSSTTARPFRPLSTIRIHYASHVPGMIPGGEILISTERVTEPPTTTEEYFSEEPFTDQTYTPSISSEDDVTLVKVAGYILLERGIRWKDQLSNRHSPEYKEEAKLMHLHLERLFRSSSIAYRLWKIEIDGFSGNKKSRSVAVDFFLYLIKSHEDVSADHLVSVLHEKLSANNTFARFRVDPSRTVFERVAEERMIKTTPAPDQETVEPPIPQWAIAVIVIGAASLIFIVLFAAVTMYGRHHMRRRYSSKLNEEDMERSSGEWESKMAAAYENMAADTIYDAEDLHSDTYKKSYILD